MTVAPAWRRWLFASLVTLTTAAALGLMVWTLQAGGFDWLDALLVLCFAMTLPWTVIGFWNAVIGLVIMRVTADPAQAVCPVLAKADDRGPITSSTALLSCIRNEDAALVARNLDRMIDELADAGVADRFRVYVLSDSTWPEVIAAEEEQIGWLADRWRGVIEVIYRRRAENPGFKAGNVRDFCARWGAAHDFMLVLDADSLMAAETILRMVRTLQAHPQLGILQTLMVGLPSDSAFARPFQFGMRLGMKSYSIGAAWWQGDAGPYWGHNALIRLRPFIDHCELPQLAGQGPLSGWVLSHDQLEAAWMRRAGYQVRVMPIEGGSWEENPPTLLEFIRRDLRWCQGNIQYLRLRRDQLAGLHPVSRWQLRLAVMMFLASPAWVLLMLVGVLRLGFGEAGPVYLPAPGVALFALVMAMVFAPKLATIVDALSTRAGRQRYGGSLRLIVGSLAEVGFSTLLAPIMAIAHSLFLLGLLFGRAVVWEAQRRVTHGVHPLEALRRLWPQTLFGVFGFAWLALHAPPGALVISPFFVGALLAVPIAVSSAAPALGRLVTRVGLWRTPDEVEPAPLVRAVKPDLAAAVARPTGAPLAALRETAVTEVVD
ncbi:glucan biosynthesis glucosyltransferase H [Lamprobacter modestohalophilus]|uniref:Glucans biosynthesis glucosyltransferase H n=1 Tax=Lamprobacter modestohalophilus TaxID=1064514 RepID=A0A9X1B2S8_9GAMM|nr:glucans biosynthesis glucosyltransferase MdoH [Lamprobacter modestohalophilus]MBK1617264.1 glucan biosynthesis glucosyltransferase H [Lamprobacter modestohalophilus]